LFSNKQKQLNVFIFYISFKLVLGKSREHTYLSLAISNFDVYKKNVNPLTNYSWLLASR